MRLEGRIVYGRKPGGKKKATRATRGLDVPPITGEMKEGAFAFSSVDVSGSKLVVDFQILFAHAVITRHGDAGGYKLEVLFAHAV